MSYETGPTKGAEHKFRSVFTTHGSAMDTGCAVAWVEGSEVEDTGDGTGYGYAVDYPSATTSIVVGVLWDPSGITVQWIDQRRYLAISRGICSSMTIFGTATQYEVLEPYVTAVHGYGTSLGTRVSAVWHPGIFARSMVTGGAVTATGTITAFITTQI